MCQCCNRTYVSIYSKLKVKAEQSIPWKEKLIKRHQKYDKKYKKNVDKPQRLPTIGTLGHDYQKIERSSTLLGIMYTV